jgi:hypothetical protein
MADKLCPKCGLVPLPGCNGLGHISIDGDDLTMRMCHNLFVQSMRKHLGKQISGARHVGSTPLISRTGGVDRTGDNLHITGCTWAAFLSHLKLVLYLKGLNFKYCIITDQHIKNVYVGNEHRKVRDADQVSFNSLGDLVGGFNLVIVKLGYIGYKNIAAAGALKEALLIREALALPTWVIEDPNHAWTHSCDADVERYIEDEYDRLTIEGGEIEPEEDPADMGHDPDPEEEFMPNLATSEPNFGIDLPGDDGRPDRGGGGSGELDLPGESSQPKRWSR